MSAGLVNYMDQHGYATCTPRMNNPDLEDEPVIDFNSGYILRALDSLPASGIKNAVAAAPELREGPFHDALRPRRRRHDGARPPHESDQHRSGCGQEYGWGTEWRGLARRTEGFAQSQLRMREAALPPDVRRGYAPPEVLGK